MEVQERTEQLVSLTPAAAVKIRALMAEEADVSVLRVAIEGGGCSGFQYGLGFDRGAQEGDHRVRVRGREGRRRPVQRPVPHAARASTTSRRSRSPGSRSTTRTPSRPAAAATRSRSKTAPSRPRSAAAAPAAAPSTASTPAAPAEGRLAQGRGMTMPSSTSRRSSSSRSSSRSRSPATAPSTPSTRPTTTAPSRSTVEHGFNAHAASGRSSSSLMLLLRDRRRRRPAREAAG